MELFLFRSAEDRGKEVNSTLIIYQYGKTPSLETVSYLSPVTRTLVRGSSSDAESTRGAASCEQRRRR